jgi:polyphosphate kinase 2 (PPK2 family)
MLEKIDLERKLPKREYKAKRPVLQRRLYDLEKACWDAKVPSVIVFEGWDTAGKGTAIRLLTSRMDPRGFKLYPIQAPRKFEKRMPWLWRFWIKLPKYGEMAIFDRSWYGRVLVERVEGLIEEHSWRQAYRDIVSFERTITDDGYVLIKFLIHISRQEQERRFKRLESDPLTSWIVQPEDWEHHAKYDEYVLAMEEMLERTETEWGPWTIVEGTDKRWTRVKIFETIIERLEGALVERGFELPPPRRRRREEESPVEGALRDLHTSTVGVPPAGGHLPGSTGTGTDHHRSLQADTVPAQRHDRLASESGTSQGQSAEEPTTTGTDSQRPSPSKPT